jgi:hypothetical protein
MNKHGFCCCKSLASQYHKKRGSGINAMMGFGSSLGLVRRGINFFRIQKKLGKFLI